MKSFQVHGHDTEEELRKAVREMQSRTKNNRMTDYREQLLPQLVNNWKILTARE